jgi:hypothetical protein
MSEKSKTTSGSKRSKRETRTENEDETNRHVSPTVTPTSGKQQTKKARTAEAKAAKKAQADKEAEAQAKAEEEAENQASLDRDPDAKDDDLEEGEEDEFNSQSDSESGSEKSGYDSEDRWVHCSGGVKILHEDKEPEHDEKDDYEPEMEFDATKFECEYWMTKHEVMLTLLERAKAAEGNIPAPQPAPAVMHMGDTKHFLLKAGNVGAEGFKSLRDCLADQRRNGRTISRDVLIPLESVKLITQTLYARGLIPDNEPKVWQAWTDEVFFAEMAKIHPASGRHSLSLHDALRLLEFHWYLNSHPRSLLKFLTELNEVMRIYEPEIRAAEALGKLKNLEAESVKILLSRLIASKVDTARQPVLVRQQLKMHCTQVGLPASVDELIQRILTQAERVYIAVQEAKACGLAATRIGKGDAEGDH